MQMFVISLTSVGWHHLMVVLGTFNLLGSTTGSCPVSNLARPEGTSVTLNMPYNSTAAADIHVVEWESNEWIVRYYPGKNKLVVQSLYKARVMFDNNTFSLELMNLQTDDGGFYNGVVTHKERGRICGAKFNLSVSAPCSVTNLSRSEGTSVTLSIGSKSIGAADITAVEWFKGKSIIRYYPGITLEVQQSYKSRVKFDNNTFSLELMNLQNDDSGFFYGVITEKSGTICADQYLLSVVAPCSVTNLSRSEGTSVTLSIGSKSIGAADITVVEWIKGEFIIRFLTGITLEVQPSYKSRVKFDNNTFSLELMNLQKDDSGSFYGVITEKSGTICADQYLLSVVDSTYEERGNSAQITSPASLSIMTAGVLVFLNIAFW